MNQRPARYPAMPPPFRAFTLIELLMVIAIIAVLLGILLSALAGARAAGRASVGLSNLRQCALSHAAYAQDYHDGLINPFDKNNPTLWGVQWYEIVALPSANATGGTIQRYNYGDSDFCTHLFSVSWASVMTQYITGNDQYSAVLVDPNDDAMLRRHKAGRAATLGIADYFLWDTSYWSPPTLWLNTVPYKTASRVQVSGSDVRYWRRNRMDDVTSPQAKVLVFERFDCSKKSRPARAGGRESYHPTFNNPEATTRFSTADGSVDSIKMSKMFKLIDPASASQAQIDSFTPAGRWELPDLMLGDPTFASNPGNRPGRDALENGDGSVLGVPSGVNKFVGWFWATRQGLQGRDIPR